MKGSELVLLPDVGHGFSKTYKWAPQFRQAFRKIVGEDTAETGPPQLPPPRGFRRSMTCRSSKSPPRGPGGQALAVMISGDGGWAGIDKDVSGALAAKGIPVVGWNSLQYFWTARKPDAAARDLERILRHYLAVWDKQEVLLIGYSFGADVLPFFASRLPADLLGRVRLVALLGPSETADFEFHVTDWLGGGSKGQPVLPEVKKLGRAPARPLSLRQPGEGQHLPAESPPPPARRRCCRAPTTSEGTTTSSPR